jgi:hypothetical protein
MKIENQIEAIDENMEAIMVAAVQDRQKKGKKYMKLTINYNGFHGVDARTIAVEGKPGDRVKLTPSQVKKLRSAGCGVNGCQCGESFLKVAEMIAPWQKDCPAFITVPEFGTEIEVVGNYPQI